MIQHFQEATDAGRAKLARGQDVPGLLGILINSVDEDGNRCVGEDMPVLSWPTVSNATFLCRPSMLVFVDECTCMHLRYMTGCNQTAALPELHCSRSADAARMLTLEPQRSSRAETMPQHALTCAGTLPLWPAQRLAPLSFEFARALHTDTGTVGFPQRIKPSKQVMHAWQYTTSTGYHHDSTLPVCCWSVG